MKLATAKIGIVSANMRQIIESPFKINTSGVHVIILVAAAIVHWSLAVLKSEILLSIQRLSIFPPQQAEGSPLLVLALFTSNHSSGIRFRTVV